MCEYRRKSRVSDAYMGTWNAIPTVKPNKVLAFVCKIEEHFTQTYEQNTVAK